MSKIILITAPVTLAYLILAWFTGNFLRLQGTNLWIWRIALSLIGIAAAAVVVWFLANKKKEEERAAAGAEEEAQEGGDEIAVLIREAEKKLSTGQLEKGARIGNLPAILLLGEAGGAKTSTVLNSALEPELLAGQALKDGDVISTRSANLWYSRRTLLVEASGKLMDDATARAILFKRMQPRKAVVGKGGQAPRAALVCVEIERITGSGQAMAALALKLRSRLGEIAQSFGIHLPVYVLFTKTDQLTFFPEFVRNLSNEEATQALGVTLPIVALTSGVYAEERTKQLGGYLDQLFRSLCDARPEFLSREKDATKLPGTYEFPREFRKLRGQMVQFLVDLCRPSQLTVGPFLRGFYFSGVRPVTIQETAPAAERSAPAAQASPPPSATVIFRVPSGGPGAAAVPQRRVAVTRRVPQWLFLSHLFNEVLLADRVAMGASRASAKTDLVRRILLISAAVICLICCIGFTVSFFLNRRLERQIADAVSGSSVAPVGTNLASVESLRRLDSLRQSLQTLTEYNREGAPWGYRWGLYIGDDLYPDVRHTYFTRFRQLLLGQTQNTLVTFLSGLPAASGPTSPLYDPTYDKLKAYLITTSNPEKSTREFLSPVLLNTWSATVDPDRKLLAQTQFDFYSDELQREDPFPKQNDNGAVAAGRHYLNQFAEFDRIYQNMKAGAPKTVINFNKQVAGSKEYVVDTYDVTGPFTKEGWSFMSDAVKNPNRYVHGDEWVLGPHGLSSDHSSLIAQLQAQYKNDFITQWRNYLKSATFVSYKDAKDAAQKLDALSGNASALLQLLELASNNTDVDDTVIKALQPAHLVTPPNSVRLIGPQNQSYITALSTLQASMDAVAKSADPSSGTAADRVIADAAAARQTVKQLRDNFNADSEAHIDTVAANLLYAPIVEAEKVIQGGGDLNAKGQDLCGKYGALLRKYPFNPAGTTEATVDEFNTVFRKPDGLLWAFYGSLTRFLTKQDNRYVAVQPAGAILTQRFIDFFNQAAQFSEAAYAGDSKDPHFTYTMKWVPLESAQQGASLQIDGQTQTYSTGAPSAKQFTWQGSGTHGIKASVIYGGTDFTFATSDGLWAVFRFFSKANRWDRAQTGDLLEWAMLNNTKDPVTVGGRPVIVRFELNMAGAPSIFRKEFFSHMACVADVAKQQ
jgi:type VI secretion system protein ImpL